MLTVNQILDRYVGEHLPTLGARSRVNHARHIKILRKEFGGRIASELRPSDFDAFMNVEKGRQQRNRILAVLSSAFTKAVNWNLLSHNVCNVVARHPEKPRDR
jgi:hypothetical protein